MRAMMERRLLPEAIGREEAWLADRLARRRNANGAQEVARQGGLRLLVQERRLTDGGLVTVALDVTERKEAEAAAAEREALLDSIFENLPVGLVIKNRDHVVVRANRTTLARYGVTKAALVGRRMEAAGVFQSNEADIASKMEQENRVMATGAPMTRDVVQVGVDGQRRVLRITKFPIFDAAGEVVQIGSAGVDLTDQIAARQALRESEARFRDFAEIASDWLWETGADHRFVRFYAQDKPHSTIDLPRTVGKTRWEMAGPGAKDDPAWRAHMAVLEAREEFRDFEYWFVDRHGD
ncbi:MAG: PAS domain-containing protein, partial [Alphaproteobacteria bacterium]